MVNNYKFPQDGSFGSLGDDFRSARGDEMFITQGTGGNLPPTARTPLTGGNLPPMLTTTMGTGGNNPAQLGGTSWVQPPPPTTVGTGGNNPPSLTPWEGGKYPIGTGGHAPGLPEKPPVTQGTGGNNPAVPFDPSQWRGGKPPQVTQGTGGNLPPNPSQVNLQGGFSPANVVTDTMNQIVDPNGAYIRNARRRGLEQAAMGGNRAGGSIAAGASQRAALESAAPLFNAAMQLQGQREGFAFQGEQNQLERNRDYTRAQLEDWANSRQFNREFYGVLSMMPINSAYQLNSLIQTYALENPEIYTAEVISGMSNFFNQNFAQVLSTYFPQYSNRPGG